MARWDHGYVTDVAYTTNTYQETMPTWLAACSLLLGYRPTDLASAFRYADLGCGNGLNALIVAATCPRAEVWGFDFNPTHIENARTLAEEAGLDNAHFEEVSFAALAGGAHPAGDAFDIIVSHGVLSWISLENRQYLTTIIGQRLRPGGLAYLSYNVATGWSGVEPLRILMRQLAEADPRRTDQAIGGMFQAIEHLREGGAAFFQTHLGLEQRVRQMRDQDPRYIAHEFLNRDWDPVMFADVAEVMAENRTIYIGSATPIENIDAAAVPAGTLSLIAGTVDPLIRETLRDLASAKNFRRDLWRKGGEPMPALERVERMDLLRLAWTGRSIDGDITFQGPLGTVTGQPEFYRPLLEAVRRAPTSIGALRAAPGMRDREISEFVQAALLLIGGGYVHPMLPDEPGLNGAADSAREGASRLNRAIVRRLRLGVDLRRLVAPRIGSSIGIDVMEGLVIAQFLDGGSREPEALIDGVLADVARSGRTLLRDGKPLGAAEDVRVHVGETVRNVLASRLPLLRELGVVA